MGNGKGQRKTHPYVPQVGQRATIDPTFFTGRRPAPRGPAAGGPPASMFGAGVSMDEQGPTQAGGTLAGITAPGVSRDIIQSRYGPRIDLGPIFRPRSTGANPLTGDPFQATSSVGGFFRRLLGDNADELNAQWQQARIANQLAAQGKADERAFELEKLKLADQLTGAREAAGRDFTKELQGQQQGFMLGQAMNKEIADSADREAQREFVKGQNLQRDIFDTLKQESANAQRMKELEMTGNAALDKALLGGRAPTPGKWSQVGEMYVSPEGQMMQFDLKSNSMVPVRMPNATPATQGGVTDDERDVVRQKTAAFKEQSALEAPAQPTSAMSGLGEILGQLPNVVAESPLGAAALDIARAGTAQPVLQSLSGLSSLMPDLKSAGGTSAVLEQQKALERKLAKKRNVNQ